MRAPDFTSAHWRKSTRSNGTGACVEVARITDVVGIRDSKLGKQSPVMAMHSQSWNNLRVHLKTN